MWDVHSPIIYYWTSEMADGGHAYIIVYHGGICEKSANSSYASIGFRAVKDVS